MDTDIQFNPQTESLSGIVSTLHVVSEHPTGYDSPFEELYSFFNIFQCLNLRRVKHTIWCKQPETSPVLGR